MEIDDMTIHMIALRTAYPHAWPNSLSTEALMATWFDSFQHVSNELFAAAVKHAIATHEWPSIKDMWESILTVAGVPTLFDAQESMRRYVDRCFNSSVPKLKIEDHTLIKKTLRAMGDHADIANMGSYAQKNLADYFQENRRAYRDRVIQPQGIEKLESAYRKALQLTTGHVGQITE